jgi:hypothetical protein
MQMPVEFWRVLFPASSNRPGPARIVTIKLKDEEENANWIC